MEDTQSLDTTSNFSSLAGVPDHLESQYAPLEEMFEAHHTELPAHHQPVESNSDAMIQALKALQDKLRALELERLVAADKFRHVELETERYSRGATVDSGVLMDTPFQTASVRTTPQTLSAPFSPTADDVRVRLESLDSRFSVQARELARMREQLHQAESSRHDAELRARQTEQERRSQQEGHFPPSHLFLAPTSQPTPPAMPVCMETEEKLRRLEEEQVKLNTNHSATQRKLRSLERCLKEEQHQHRTVANTLPMGRPQVTLQPTASTEVQGQAQKGPVRKRKKVSQRHAVSCACGYATRPGLESLCCCKPVPGVHYRMNLRDVPFVVGMSATPSHSVAANYQQVLSLMKAHSPVLCGAVAASQGKRAGGRRGRVGPSSGPSLSELRALLAGLEEEFGHLTFGHQELAGKLEASQRRPFSSDRATKLEGELQKLSEHLEVKAEQIGVVKKQIKCRSRKTRRECEGNKSMARLSMQRDGEVEVTTTVRTRGQTTPGARTGSAGPITPSLGFLKKMRSLQSTLQQDDLAWD